MTIYPVVMAGGSGTRFWPLSRKARPKQFLALATDRPLIIETVNRLKERKDRMQIQYMSGSREIPIQQSAGMYQREPKRAHFARYAAAGSK